MQLFAVQETTDRWSARVGPTTLRWILGLLWLSNLNWKVPTAFGGTPPECGGLCGYAQAGVDHPVVPGSSWVFEHLIVGHLGVFGWMTLFVEGALAALLLSGRFLRVAAIVSALQSIAIGLAVANAPNEWFWAYLVMLGLSLAVLVVAPRTPRQSPRATALVAVGYGVVVALSHLGAGFTGDGNTDWTLFSGRRDIPDEFGTNTFPGSIALGLLFVAVGVAAWFLAEATEQVRRWIGWIAIATAVVLALTYRSDGLALGLGSRATSAAVLAMVGLALLPGSRGERASSASGAP
jgi:hypothetical protein